MSRHIHQLSGAIAMITTEMAIPPRANTVPTTARRSGAQVIAEAICSTASNPRANQAVCALEIPKAMPTIPATRPMIMSVSAEEPSPDDGALAVGAAGVTLGIET